MEYAKLSTEIEDYILDYLHQNADAGLTYHNAGHARFVAASALKIAGSFELEEEELFVLQIAALFHDVGYLEGPQGHEERSAQFAGTYLRDKGLNHELIQKIKSVILATEGGHQPVGRLEEIIRDADLYHLGTDGFEEKNKMLYKEQEYLQRNKINKSEWLQQSVEFLENHAYHTTFCKINQGGKKAKNIQILQDKIKKIKAGSQSVREIKTSVETVQKKRPEKGVDTVFKISSNNSQRLSSMADNKAHILITVNSIILSAMISLVMRKLSDNHYLIVPTVLILIVSLSSMIFSILSTRPKVPRGTFSPSDLQQRKVNLLFFGNFYKMDMEQYEEGMLMMMEDQDYLYKSLIKDIYFQGVVLGKKYAFLRLAYNIFMFGLIIAVAAFAIVSILHGQSAAIQPL